MEWELTGSSPEDDRETRQEFTGGCREFGRLIDMPEKMIVITVVPSVSDDSTTQALVVPSVVVPPQVAIVPSSPRFSGSCRRWYYRCWR
ncbi:hypothetical protein GW17_00015313 [Ensete ventricosum]|nr:hypothetical protein GW17_00015313 [Ensete ventricosum]